MMEGRPRRLILRSDPSGSMYLASEPVVFASTRRPSARKTAASMRVTLDLPRVPVTAILEGMELRQRRSRTRSSTKHAKVASTASNSSVNVIAAAA
jgi:hypothetical protein